MPRGKKVTPEEREHIKSLLKSGKTTDQICDLTKRSSLTIGKIRAELKRNGFDIWHRSSKVAESIPVPPADAKVEHTDKRLGKPSLHELCRYETFVFRGSGRFQYKIEDCRITVYDNMKSFSIRKEELEAFILDLMELDTLA